jgi:hypothetical protein
MTSLPVTHRLNEPLNHLGPMLDARSNDFRLLLVATIPFRHFAGRG